MVGRRRFTYPFMTVHGPNACTCGAQRLAPYIQGFPYGVQNGVPWGGTKVAAPHNFFMHPILKKNCTPFEKQWGAWHAWGAFCTPYIFLHPIFCNIFSKPQNFLSFAQKPKTKCPFAPQLAPHKILLHPIMGCKKNYGVQTPIFFCTT